MRNTPAIQFRKNGHAVLDISKNRDFFVRIGPLTGKINYFILNFDLFVWAIFALLYVDRWTDRWAYQTTTIGNIWLYNSERMQKIKIDKEINIWLWFSFQYCKKTVKIVVIMNVDEIHYVNFLQNIPVEYCFICNKDKEIWTKWKRKFL